jgi:hypothetical protein
VLDAAENYLEANEPCALDRPEMHSRLCRRLHAIVIWHLIDWVHAPEETLAEPVIFVALFQVIVFVRLLTRSWLLLLSEKF